MVDIDTIRPGEGEILTYSNKNGYIYAIQDGREKSRIRGKIRVEDLRNKVGRVKSIAASIFINAPSEVP